MKNLLFPILASFALSGCVTSQITPDTRNKLNQTQLDIQKAPVGLLINPCLIHNEVGRDLILNEPSQLTTEKFIQSFTHQLNLQGVHVSTSSAPFICGSMNEEQFKKLDIKIDQSSERTTITTFPILNSKDKSMTEEQRNAVLAFNLYVQQDDEISLKNSRNTKVILPRPTLTEENITFLKDWSKSNYIFAVSIDGLDASVGNKFAMGTLSLGVTLATLGAGGGLVTSYIPKEGQFYTVRLYDLDKREFIWSKTSILKGKIFSSTNHSLEADKILDPLFELTVK